MMRVLLPLSVHSVALWVAMLIAFALAITLGLHAVTDTHDDEQPRRRVSDHEPDEPRLNVKWSIVFQVLGYVLGLFVIWNALTNRMTAVEIRSEQMRLDISEMKADVKTLLSRKAIP